MHAENVTQGRPTHGPGGVPDVALLAAILGGVRRRIGTEVAAGHAPWVHRPAIQARAERALARGPALPRLRWPGDAASPSRVLEPVDPHGHRLHVTAVEASW